MNRKLIFETPAPFISASSWIIVDKTNGEILFAKNENEQRQIASLTKIMTCFVILRLMERYGIGEHKEIIKVMPTITTIIGTSANIMPCEHLSVWELLHGMMLPSGNDAA
jgi:D-alanyl-D-alanine carboxypeptidase